MSSKVDLKKAKQEVSSKSKGKVGEWVRHISSSGKEYYYNVNTHASQWEKPREWLEYEKRHGPVPNQPSSSSKPPSHQSSSSHNSSVIHQQQSERERAIEQQREWYNNSNMRENSQNANATSSSYGHHSQSASQSHLTSAQHSAHHQQQQHGHGSHPRSNQYQQQSQQQSSQQQQQQRHPSQHFDQYGHERHHSSSSYGSHAVTSSAHGGSHSGGRIAPPEATSSSRHSHGMRDSRKQSEDLNSEDMDISPIENSNSPLSVKSSCVSGPGGITSTSQHSISLNDRERDRDNRDRDRDRDIRDRDNRDDNKNYRSNNNNNNNNGIRERDRLGRDRDNRNRDQGDSRDRGRPRERDRDRDHRDHERSRSHLRDDRSQSPWDKDGTPERQDSGEASTGVNSMGRLSSLGPETETSAALAPLPSSLALYYREDLVAHVKNLPGDAAERQATKMGEEMLAASAIQLSKVSTELKMARSLVRLTDIQATLQEQRILFLREQIRKLEESEKDNSSAMLGV